MNNPQSGAAATDRRYPINDDIQPDGRAEPGTYRMARIGEGQRPLPCSTLVETARRCSAKPDALAIDADLIRVTPTTLEDLALRRSVVTTESETPEWALRRDAPQRVKQPGAAMNTKKPLQPRRNSDLKFFVLCVGITVPVHQRRRASAQAAVNRATDRSFDARRCRKGNRR